MAAGRFSLRYRIFRHNVFTHIGHISTLAQPKGRYNPGCYALLCRRRPLGASTRVRLTQLTLTAAAGASHKGRSEVISRRSQVDLLTPLLTRTVVVAPLRYDWLLPAEVFNRKDCPEDDLWPCTESASPSFFPKARLLFSAKDWSGYVKMAPVDALRSMESLAPLRPRATSAASFSAANSASAAAAAAAAAAATTAAAEPGGRAAAAAAARVARAGDSCTETCAREGQRCAARSRFTYDLGEFYL